MPTGQRGRNCRPRRHGHERVLAAARSDPRRSATAGSTPATGVLATPTAISISRPANRPGERRRAEGQPGRGGKPAQRPPGRCRVGLRRRRRSAGNHGGLREGVHRRPRDTLPTRNSSSGSAGDWRSTKSRASGSGWTRSRRRRRAESNAASCSPHAENSRDGLRRGQVAEPASFRAEPASEGGGAGGGGARGVDPSLGLLPALRPLVRAGGDSIRTRKSPTWPPCRSCPSTSSSGCNCLPPESEIVRTLTSSATSSQIPSRILLDQTTAQPADAGVGGDSRLSAGGPTAAIYRSGHPAGRRGRRRPRAFRRVAGMRGYLMAATKKEYVLKQAPGGLTLDVEKLLAVIDAWKAAGEPFCLLGYTYILYQHVVRPLARAERAARIAGVHVHRPFRRLEAAAAASGR